MSDRCQLMISHDVEYLCSTLHGRLGKQWKMGFRRCVEIVDQYISNNKDEFYDVRRTFSQRKKCASTVLWLTSSIKSVMIQMVYCGLSVAFVPQHSTRTNTTRSSAGCTMIRLITCAVALLPVAFKRCLGKCMYSLSFSDICSYPFLFFIFMLSRYEATEWRNNSSTFFPFFSHFLGRNRFLLLFLRLRI